MCVDRLVLGRVRVGVGVDVGAHDHVIERIVEIGEERVGLLITQVLDNIRAFDFHLNEIVHEQGHDRVVVVVAESKTKVCFTFQQRNNKKFK